MGNNLNIFKGIKNTFFIISVFIASLCKHFLIFFEHLHSPHFLQQNGPICVLIDHLLVWDCGLDFIPDEAFFFYKREGGLI
jgi:hypothetical protein